ncbi:MAG: hypothetical protein ABEJ23_02295 [Haloarculaceae archaeon]
MSSVREARVRYPLYGTVERLVWLALLAFVVWSATAAVVQTVAALAPATPWLRAAVVGAVALVAVGVAAREYRRQRTATRSFLAREVLGSFLDQNRPGPGRHLVAIVLTAAGAAGVWRAGDRFVATLDGAFYVLRTAATTGDPAPFDPANLLWGAAFLLAVAALARGLDRLVVGGYRELLYRRYLRRRAS